jgi:predicted ATPase
VEDVETLYEGLAAQQHFLVDIGLREWPDETSSGRYQFAHVLYRQMLYEGLGTARRRQLHRRIGVQLEMGYGAQAGTIAAQLAVHFERGGEIQCAVHYWQQAGDNAARRNAYPEALAHLTRGLELLATLPDSPERARHELTLQLLLHLPYPDVPQAEACFHQARAVARAQQARVLELRAAISLSRLWRQQGQPDAACQLLTPIYSWFTEGFTTPDLHEAKVLCEVLSRG